MEAVQATIRVTIWRRRDKHSQTARFTWAIAPLQQPAFTRFSPCATQCSPIWLNQGLACAKTRLISPTIAILSPHLLTMWLALTLREELALLTDTAADWCASALLLRYIYPTRHSLHPLTLINPKYIQIRDNKSMRGCNSPLQPLGLLPKSKGLISEGLQGKTIRKPTHQHNTMTPHISQTPQSEE